MNQDVLKVTASLNAKEPIRVIDMSGDASSRLYKRLIDAHGKTFILMELPPGPHSLAEEKTPGDLQRIQELPFVNVQRFLAQHHVQVPAILGQGADFLLLEDLGDTTVFDWIRTAQPDPKALAAVYTAAIDQLLLMHHATPPATCIAATRKFDAQLYNWEFDHFVEYGIQWLLDSKKQHTDLKNYLYSISDKLAALPLCFTHRDFHAKNLMLKSDGTVWVLDFQDAIMAPGHYDLASLLFDSYVDLPDSLVDQLTAYYFSEAGERITGGSFEQFVQELRLMAMQRNLKAAGRFIYIYVVKKKPTHIAFVQPTLRKVQEHLKVLGATDDFISQFQFPALEAAALEKLKV